MKKSFFVLFIVLICTTVYAANYPNVTVRDTDGIQLQMDANGRIGVNDSRYETKVSTCITGRVTADGIVEINFGITDARLQAEGGTEIVATSTNAFSGSMYLLPNDITEVEFAIPTAGTDNDITIDLTAGDTLYYTISGVIAE